MHSEFSDEGWEICKEGKEHKKETVAYFLHDSSILCADVFEKPAMPLTHGIPEKDRY